MDEALVFFDQSDIGDINRLVSASWHPLVQVLIWEDDYQNTDEFVVRCKRQQL